MTCESTGFLFLFKLANHLYRDVLFSDPPPAPTWLAHYAPRFNDGFLLRIAVQELAYLKS